MSPPPMVGSEFVASTQVFAGALSSILCAFMASIGTALFVTPSLVIDNVFGCLEEADSITELEATLARTMGGIMCALSLSSFLLLLPFWTGHSNSHACSVDKLRTSLSSQTIVGLSFVIVGLWDDRLSGEDSHCGLAQYGGLLVSGAIFVVLSCLGLMASFWPLRPDAEEGDRASYSLVCCRRRRSPPISFSSDLEEPLLLGDVPSVDDEAAAEAALDLLLGDQPSAVEEAAAVVAHEPQSSETGDSGSDDAADGTSRIRGTRRLIKLAAPQVFYLYLGCAVLLVRLPFSLSIPHFVSTTLGALSRGDYASARMEILLLFILGTIDAALDFWCVFLFGYAKERIVRGVRVDTFASILRQEVCFFDRHTSGELASRLSSDCGEMAGDLTWFFRFSIESIVRISGITVYMLIRSPLLGGCALCIVPFVAVINKMYGDWLRKNAIAVQTALAEANSVAQEALSCVRTVISFAAENFEHTKYTEKIDVQYKLNIRQLYMTGVYYMAISTFLINTCVKAILLLIGTSMIEHGKLTAEVLLAFMLYQGQLQSEVVNLLNSYSSLIKSSGAGDKVFGLLDRKPHAPGTGSPVVVSHEDAEEEAVDSRAQTSVELRNVDFQYPSRPSHNVLKGLSLMIPAGKTVALVGKSGCGKSTIVGLLQRFYDPSSGEVLIDGVDLRSMDIKAHRRHLGTVTQDPVLFSGTILSNITYKSPTADRAKAMDAAKLANAHDFVMSFPEAYDTEVGERGIQLSGGQKQRIAIARAIAMTPSLLLLDEATSALDADSEQVVQDALDKLLNTNNGMTTVVVAHRLRTVRNADAIAFIEDGAVVELGSHKALMQIESGRYRKMVERAGDDGQLPDR